VALRVAKERGVLYFSTALYSASMPSDLFTKWLQPLSGPDSGIAIYGERKGARATGLQAVKKLIGDHFVGETVILRAGGYAKAAAIIANSLPSNKRTQSGDLGELLATEYVNSETSFVVPINKLRWKSDREMAMHGNDIVAVERSGKIVRVLKGECKSRASFGKNVVDEAVESLDKHDGRPNPSTLAFITKRLYEEERDDEAEVFRDLQTAAAIPARSITHMIFALSGNDPSMHLRTVPKPKRSGITREAAAIVVSDHGEFITKVFT